MLTRLGLTYLHFVAAGGHLKLYMLFSAFVVPSFVFPEKQHVVAVTFGIYVWLCMANGSLARASIASIHGPPLDTALACRHLG